MIQWIKNLKYPAGKYKVVGVLSDQMENKKGENLKELFARRDELIREYIRAGYPEMNRSIYFTLPTNSSNRKYRMSVGDGDDVGAVIERKEDGNFSLKLYNLK